MLALTLTVAGVEAAKLSPPLAHAITLFLVFFCNFFALAFFVFPNRSLPLWTAFRGFALSTLGFRCLEWLTFTILVSELTIDYKIAVIVVTPGFALMKFLFLRTHVFG